MLEVESGISPNMIVDRRWRSVDSPAELREIGFADYQCRPGLLIPEWTTSGVQRGYKLRPDNPRIGKNGKPIKYESPAGSRLQLDCPPSMTHALRDPTIPLYVTEGSKKADAAASHGLACVSISGVYGFMRRKLVLDDLDDIDLEDRAVRVAFDSDVTTNPKVADALHRLCAALSRRGANVEVTTFTDADGVKVGFDDYFANGGTVDGLDALTRPWDGRAPLEGPEPTGDLEAEVVHLRKVNRALVLLIKNPAIPHTSKMLAVSTITLAHAETSRGNVETDGYVRLESRKIANDHRPIPARGEPRMAVNPLDGTRPLAARSRVAKTLGDLADQGLIDVVTDRVQKTHPKTGDRYWDTEILVRPAASPDLDYGKIADFGEYKERKSYTYQEPCPECGEVHSRTRRTFCNGCGAETDAPRIIPVQARQDVAAEPDDPPESAMRKNVLAKDGPPPSVPGPINSLSTNNVMAPPLDFDHPLAARLAANGWE